MSEFNESINKEVISVNKTDKGFEVKVPFELSSMLHAIVQDGVEYDKEVNLWRVPLEKEEQLDAFIRRGTREMENASIALDDIYARASETLTNKFTEMGISDCQIDISSYKRRDGHFGEIINVNSHFAAQFTGVSDENKKAYISVHRLSDLKRNVYKGDNVEIRYDDKGKGVVSDRGLYRAGEGVKVEKDKDSIYVSFKYNPEMVDRLSWILPEAKLDKEKGVFVIPKEEENKVRVAVNQLRGIYRDTIAEEKELAGVALQKVDTARCSQAFTKDGMRHQGTIVEMSDRYALVHQGGDEFKLHRRDALGETKGKKFLEKGQKLDVVYEKGRAKPFKVKMKEKSQSQSQGLER